MSIVLGALLASGAVAVVPSQGPVSAPAHVAPSPAAKASPATISPGTTVTAAPRPTRDQVLAAVRSEWSKYDRGDKGRLTPLEFSTWVMQSHGGSVAARAHGRGIAPVSAMNASSTAFARADGNHDGGVTPDEMTRFLMMPPTPTALSRARTATHPVPAKPLEALVGN